MNRNDSADKCQQFEAPGDPSTDDYQQYETSDDPLNPWPGLDPLKIALELCRKGVCTDLNSDLSQGKSWLQLTGYQRLYYIFKFRELLPSFQQDVLSAASTELSKPNNHSKTRLNETRSTRKPRSTFDDFIRLFHMYNDPSLASLWSNSLSNTAPSGEVPRHSKQHYLERLVNEFNDYDKNSYTNCTADVVTLTDGRIVRTPKAGMEAAYEACKGLNPSNRASPTRDLDWLVTKIKEIKRDLMAVNYIRYINSGLPHMENPYIPFKQFVTEDAKQQYALHLFQGFVDVILQEDELGTGLGRPASSCWLYFDRITVMGAVRARCRYCGHTFAINTCRLMAHLSGRMTASLSGVTLCTKTPPYVARMLAQEFDNEQVRKKKNQKIAHVKQQRLTRTLPPAFEKIAPTDVDVGDHFSSGSSLKPLSDSSSSDSDAEGQPEPADEDKNPRGPFVSLNPTISVSRPDAKREPANNSTSIPHSKSTSKAPIVSPANLDGSTLVSLMSPTPLKDGGLVNDMTRKRPSVTPDTPNSKRRIGEEGQRVTEAKLPDRPTAESNLITGASSNATPYASNPWESSMYLSMRSGPSALNRMGNTALPPSASALMDQISAMNAPHLFSDPRIAATRGVDNQGMTQPSQFPSANPSVSVPTSGHNFFTPAFVVPQQLHSGRSNHQLGSTGLVNPTGHQVFQTQGLMQAQSFSSGNIPYMRNRPSYHTGTDLLTAPSKPISTNPVDNVYNGQGQFKPMQMPGNWMAASNAGQQQQISVMQDLYMQQMYLQQRQFLASGGAQAFNYGSNYSNSNFAFPTATANGNDYNRISGMSGYASQGCNGNNSLGYNNANISSANAPAPIIKRGDMRHSPTSLSSMLSQRGTNY